MKICVGKRANKPNNSLLEKLEGGKQCIVKAGSYTEWDGTTNALSDAQWWASAACWFYTPHRSVQEQQIKKLLLLAVRCLVDLADYRNLIFAKLTLFAVTA